MKSLIAILLDPTAEFGDRDDAAMMLSDSDEPAAAEALLGIVLDSTADTDLADRARESLSAIWRRNNINRPDLVSQMHPAASLFFDPTGER